MAKACATHKDQPAATMCHQCHLPICKACTTVTSHGSFCSAECSLLNREFKERLRAGGGGTPRGGVAVKLVCFLLLGLIALVAIHMAANRGAAFVRPIDLIGRLLGKMEALKPQ